MKTKASRFLALLIAFTLFLAIVPFGTFMVSAESGINERLNALRTKFPNGKYWNHYCNSDHNNNGPFSTCTSSSCMNPNSYTSSPCTTHNGVAGIGCYDCNCFDGGIQCFGFANKVFYDVFGIYASQISKRYDTSNVSVGDWVRVNNDEHSAVVLSRNGNNITIVEANAHDHSIDCQDCNCKIKWDRTISIDTITYFKRASNYDTINSTPIHTHSYGAWQTVTAATCTAAGSQKRVCSCGDTQTQTIPVLGHSSVTDQAVAATCTETGLTEGAHCSRCGAALKTQETVAALGHDFQVKSISSTCDSVTVTYKCSRCESEYSTDSSSEAYSEWVDSKPQDINEELIEARYSSRKKEYTTSTSSSLSNWTKYDTVQDGWNGWSNWQNTAVSATATRQVETRTVPAVTHTEYNYSRYLNSSAGIVGPWAGTWSGVYCGTYQERGWGVKLNNPDMSQGFAIYSDNRGGWFNETSRTVTDSAAYTQYRYRDAKYTYHYYKWSDYTAWTSQPIEADSETEVKTQYRYKIVPTGHTESDWIIDCPAQPGVAGAKHKECTECHTVLQTDIIPALEVIDENAPQVMIENKRVTAGGTVDIKIALKNNPGIASMKLQLNFGKDLILTNVAFNGEIGGNFQQPQTFASPVLLNWYDGVKNSNGDFVFATLTFKVADNATPGEKYIATTYDPEDVYNIAEQNIDFAVTGGKVEVLEYFPGDINGDGAVNNKDLTRLFQHLSGWDVAVNEAALDVNGDGNSNNKDLTRLFQYLSGWDVQIF